MKGNKMNQPQVKEKFNEAFSRVIKDSMVILDKYNDRALIARESDYCFCGILDMIPSNEMMRNVSGYYEHLCENCNFWISSKTMSAYNRYLGCSGWDEE